MKEYIKQLVGARLCLVNNHVIRKPNGETPFGPFMEVHSDFTDAYKSDLVRSLELGREVTPTFGIFGELQAAGVTGAELSASRVMVVHAWRNVSEQPLRDFPLALCDARSVEEAELIRERVSGLERYRAIHQDRHRWYWFPDMMKNEILLFKGFDSSERRYAFHSAFVHPDRPHNTAKRFSCELRVLCLLEA